MKLIPRGGIWQVHFVDTNNDRQRRSTKIKVNPNLPDKGRAMANLAALDIMRAELMADAPDEVKREAGRGRTLAYALRKTLNEHWEHQKSNREKRYQVEMIVRDVGYWPLHSITYTRLAEYGRELEQRGDAPATRNRKMSTIQTAMSFALKRGEIDKLPIFPHWPENNLKERYLALEEETALLAWIDAHAAAVDAPLLYMRALVPFLLDTGLRASEALLTRHQDLGERIWLPHGSTKSGRGRTVPLTARARECLTTMLASPYHAELLAAYARDKTVPSQRLGRLFRSVVDGTGIEEVTLHTLRHTCASRLVQAGVSLYVVKEWLGHSSIVITERYAHLAPKNLDAAVAVLEPAQNVVALPVPKADTTASVGDTVH